MSLPALYIDESNGKGRGVFTSEPIAAGTIVEVAPVIVMSAAERKLIDQTLLHDYIFEWGENLDQCAMALGWIPIYNHSFDANCEYLMDFEEGSMCIKTVKDVNEGEELFINYNGEANDPKPLWFPANV